MSPIRRVLRHAARERQFLSHIVLPDGSLVGDHVTAEIEKAYAGLPVRSMLALEGPR